MALNLEKIQSLLNAGIEVLELKRNAPACEEYIRTKFTDGNFQIETMVPFVYRRSFLELSDEVSIAEYLNNLQTYFTKEKLNNWFKEQMDFLAYENGTKATFLRILLSSYGREILQNKFPQNNNPQKQIQNIKDSGYIVAVLRGNKKNNNLTRYWILPLPVLTRTKYETMSPLFVSKVITCLGSVNIYEDRETKGILPDHKFPEIRWDSETSESNSLDMTEAQIRNKFQLLDAQRNQQKREACRKCFQTGQRGVIYGIPFYYEGSAQWDESIPKVGKAAEEGCVGCPWYDIAKWREELNKKIEL